MRDRLMAFAGYPQVTSPGTLKAILNADYFYKSGYETQNTHNKDDQDRQDKNLQKEEAILILNILCILVQ